MTIAKIVKDIKGELIRNVNTPCITTWILLLGKPKKVNIIADCYKPGSFIKIKLKFDSVIVFHNLIVASLFV